MDKTQDIHLTFNSFIDKLNALDLTDADLYVQYAVMKNAAKVLAERIQEINGLIMEEMDRLKVEKQQFDYGTFSVTERKKWTYPALILKAEEKLEARKLQSQKDGKATVEITKSLMFR